MSVDLNNIESSYSTYKVRKPKGGWRTITEPNAQLKGLQKVLADDLERRFKMSDHAFGFRKGFSCVDAASRHVKKDWILNIDVENFFPSISGKLLAFLNDFEKRIALFRDGLPQGSPCSPIISNIVMKDVDEELHSLFKERGVECSRYADDITLSGFGRIDIDEHVDIVRGVLLALDLRIKDKKTKFMPKYIRQEVLGIVVNEKISINRKTRKNLRSAIHQGNMTDREEGMLSYIQMVNHEQYVKLIKGEDE